MVGAKGSKMNFMGLTHAQSEEMEALRGIVRLHGGAKLQTTAAKTIRVQATSVSGIAKISTNIGNPSHKSCNRLNSDGSCPCPNSKVESGYCIPNTAGPD